MKKLHSLSGAAISFQYSRMLFGSFEKIGITVIVHTILCLPGESREMMLDTIRYLNTQDIQGIKLQLLHILKHTDLADYYEKHPFHLPSREEYYEVAGNVHLQPAT